MTLALEDQSVLNNLELETTWSAKVGPQYNPTQSTEYWTKLRSNGIREYGHVAPAGGGWMSTLNDLPIPDNWTSGTVKHGAMFLFDGSIIDWTDGSAFIAKFDHRISDGQGNNWNFSSQITLSRDWMWQINPQTGNLVDTGIRVFLSPFEWHNIEFENGVDFTNLQASFNSIVIDGVQTMAPSQFQNLTPQKQDWKRGSNLQMSMCRQSAGVALMYTKRIRVIWVS